MAGPVVFGAEGGGAEGALEEAVFVFVFAVVNSRSRCFIGAKIPAAAAPVIAAFVGEVEGRVGKDCAVRDGRARYKTCEAGFVTGH